jgi:hypothetical protein
MSERSSPFRIEVQFRLAPDGSGRIQRRRLKRNVAKHKDLEPVERGAWIDTDLSRQTRFDDEEWTTLGEVVTRFAEIEKPSELNAELSRRRQRRIGDLLRRAAFGADFPGHENWLHIVPLEERPPDPHERARQEAFAALITQLPWGLMTHPDQEDQFLALSARSPWSFTVAGDRQPAGAPLFRETILPWRPRVLAVTTDPIPESPTQADDHWSTEIMAELGAFFQDTVTQHLLRVKTWEAFQGHIKEDAFNPHVIYLYGHADPGGVGDAGFLFELADGRPKRVSADEISELVKRFVEPQPCLIWLNACYGSAGVRTSFARALCEVAATVIATRTVAEVGDARRIAREVLPKIIMAGKAPHVALREELAANYYTIEAGRWANNTVFVQYGLWSVLEPEKRPREELERESLGDFPMRVRSFVGRPEARGPAPQAVIWYGPGEQSLDVFARRVRDSLVEQFPYKSIKFFSVDLQQSLRPANKNDDFILAIFNALDPDPRAIRERRSARLGDLRKQFASVPPGAMLVFDHNPIDSNHAPLLREYLNLWATLGPQMESGGKLRFLLTFGLYWSGNEAPPLPQEAQLIRLSAVSDAELTEHLFDFRDFYEPAVLVKEEAEASARKLIEQENGAFQAIHFELERRAGLQWWTPPEKDRTA